MINLQKVSGLPLEVTDDFHLKLGSGVVQTRDSFVRTFDEMKPVLMDQTISAPSKEMYSCYRGVCMESDKQLIADYKLSYDITILPPLMLGKEYNKTLGHYHADIPGKSISHPEMYQVLNGSGIFLLQKMDHGLKVLKTVLTIEAQAGDKIIYPPNYGHIFLNIGQDALVTANWISTDYKAMYEPIKERHGMSYYVIKGDDGEPQFVKNENYQDHPSTRQISVSDKIRTDFGIDNTDSMYTAAMKNPKLLEFLNFPEKYALQLASISS